MSLDGCTAGRHESLALMSDRLSRAVTPDESRGLLDTSVVIDIDVIDSALLPDETVISAAKQLFFCNLTESDLRSDSPVV